MRSALLVCLLLGVARVFAQREIEDDAGWKLRDRLYFGGGFGINSGRDFNGFRFTMISVNPIVGYMVTPQFSVGTGINYTYLRYPEVNLRLDQYGASPFVRYNFGQIFAYSEYNFISTPTFLGTQVGPTRRTFDRLFVGLGYTQPIGRRGAVNIMALYDVLYDQTERAFASPWDIRVFFSF